MALPPGITIKIHHTVYYIGHRYLSAIYGTSEFPLDRWFGSNHGGTDESTATIRQQVREKLMQQRNIN